VGDCRRRPTNLGELLRVSVLERVQSVGPELIGAKARQ